MAPGRHARFLLTTFAILILLAAGATASIEAILHRLGDNWTAEEILKTTQNKPYVFGSGYSQQDSHLYKLGILSHYHPDVISIGSSRVMEFRDHSFRSPEGHVPFYNAGAPDIALLYILEFAAKVQPPYPKVIIVGVDSWALYSRSRLIDWMSDHGMFPLVLKLNRVYHFIKDLKTRTANYQHFIAHTTRWFPLLDKPVPLVKDGISYIGLGASLSADGYRNDGSHKDGRIEQWEQYPEEWKQLNDSVDNDFVVGPKPFTEWKGVAAGQKKIFQKLIDTLKEKEIKVVFILQPWSDITREKILASPLTRNTFTDIDAYFEQLEAANPNVSYHNFTSLASCGCLPTEMFDCTHPSEKCVARITLLLEQDPFLTPFVNGEKIRTHLNASTSSFNLYPTAADEILSPS